MGELLITIFVGGTLILNGVIGMLFLKSMESNKKSIASDSEKVGGL